MLRHIRSIAVLACCVHIAYARSAPPAGTEQPPVSGEAAKHGAASRPAAPAFFRLDHGGDFRTSPVTTEPVWPPIAPHKALGTAHVQEEGDATVGQTAFGENAGPTWISNRGC